MSYSPHFLYNINMQKYNIGGFDSFELFLKKEYDRFMKFKEETKEKNLVESFILVLIELIKLVFDFISDVAKYIFPSLKLNKNKAAVKVVSRNYVLKENFRKLTLLTELNFCKTFYTPS